MSGCLAPPSARMRVSTTFTPCECAALIRATALVEFHTAHPVSVVIRWPFQFTCSAKYATVVSIEKSQLG